MLPVTIRAFEARDNQVVLDIYRQAGAPGMDVPSFEEDGERRYVAEEPVTSDVIGYASMRPQEGGSFDVIVLPARQRIGIGNLLWRRLEQDLLEMNVRGIEPWAREENAVAISWLTKLGFVQIKLDGPVCLYCDEAFLPYDSLITELETKGVTISNLALERQMDKECLPKLYALYKEIRRDVPGSNESDCERWEEFVSKRDSTDAMPDAFFIAKHGQEYVGLSYLSPRQSDPNLDEPGIIQQSLTGVRAEYRRQRIALALKVKTISYARDHGFRRIFTNSGNPAMKALNKKLGFQSGPWLVFRKELDRLTDA